MKQSIVEVIAYLLEMTATHTFEATGSSTDQDFVQQWLEEAGFSEDTVESAFDWLRELIEQRSWCVSSKFDDACDNQTFRVFDPEEQAKISKEVRSFILSLEYAGILDTRMREIVISQLMQLNQHLVELIDAKWVVLLVLMSGSNENIDDIRSYLLATTELAE